MRLSLRAVGLLALGLYLAAPALAQPVGDGPYRLQTQYAGAGQCLESNDPNNLADHQGSVYMTECQDVSGQLWFVERLPSGFNRLRSWFRGDAECLEGNSSEAVTGHGGAAHMDACQDVSGQYWEIMPIRNDFGLVRLKTAYTGSDHCLESARMQDSPPSEPGSRMDACQNVTGQKWTLVPAG